MLEGLQQLIDLQQIDDELKACETELASLPERRVGLATERESAEVRVTDAGEAVRAAEMQQRTAESELEDKEALLGKLEAQQFQIKSNDAYTVLLREMEEARTAISVAETNILEAMERIETATGEQDRAERDAKLLFARASTTESELDAREKEIGEQLSQQHGTREELCGCVPSEMLAQYQRIASSRRPAVAEVRDGTCQGCRTKIPAQLHVEMLRMERLIPCTHCHRILSPGTEAK
ncbi:MAG: C4-type zinc ribbon domain-containing protein [Myxococcota bacterium]|nr:hypothetical protein [bacterium]MDP6073974.1 C4-type zinc ribbon domain-containing protein [Myxococcota bacterium]MDP6241841.1 C4-type zinc ribbon domain-containing protein [Myxococcota bacterium]MDP7076555.1 C4-type zinc ribbon domain-containing protein [Myxococcota bacterium]MDP7298362.1 C4-type zinc ribbon domain-containing protein [Myxococcota bacterium]